MSLHDRVLSLLGRLWLFWRVWPQRGRLRSEGLHTTDWESEGIRVHYYQSRPAASDRPVLVCLHGLLDSARSFRHFSHAMRGRQRLLLPDVPGYGRSTLPPIRELWQIPVMARILVRFLCDQVREPMALLGHSMGGLLILHMLEYARSTGRVLPVTGIHLVAPGLMAFSPEEREHRRRLFYPTSIPVLEDLLSHLYHAALPQIPRPLTLALLHEWNKPGLHYLADNTIENEKYIFIDEKKMVALLKGIRVHLYWGAQDRMVPLHTGKLLSRKLKAPLTVIENAGHALHLESPDRLAQALITAEDLPRRSRGQALSSPRKR